MHVMYVSYHVTSWTTAQWLSLLLILVTVLSSCKAKHLPEMCIRSFHEAEKYYYSDPAHCRTSNEDQMLIQHGHGMLHKVHFLKTWLHNHSVSSTSCPFAGRIQSRMTHFHKRQKRTHDCTLPNITCDGSSPWRTPDGSCNNLDNPTWGMSDLPQRRLLPAAYDDGKSVPRWKNCVWEPLPSPRKISNIVHKAGRRMRFHKRFTVMVAEIGQFLSHDLVLTGMAKRVRNQLNKHTSAIDLSQVYGANLEDMNALRNFGTGKLTESPGSMLMTDDEDMGCNVTPDNIAESKCFISGDARTNEQPGLASLHTLFLREHNRVVDELTKVNPSWTGEQLFQTARKIVGAEMQHIIYTEWLPVVLGKDEIARFGLETDRMSSEFKDTYDPTVDLTIANSFSTATFRFGHAMVHNKIGKLSERYDNLELEELTSHFFKTYYLHKDKKYGIENVLRWHCAAPSPLSDRMVESSVRDFLFPDERNKTLDLASLNIQRGRDHGLPSYNRLREFCNLPTASHFGTGYCGLVDHDKYEACLLEKAYRCPEDIDLFTGMLSERKHRKDILGPLQKCLLGLQFKSLRDGDRFWYEREDPITGFTIGSGRKDGRWPVNSGKSFTSWT